MRAYKGFCKDLRCRGYQYEIGGSYDEESASLCERGFHATESPLSVWSYYPPISGNRYCKVELDGVTNERWLNGTMCGTHIDIMKEMSIRELIEESVIGAGCRVSVVVSHSYSPTATKTTHASVASVGYESHSATTGFGAHAVTAGSCAHAVTAGGHAHAVTTNNASHAVTLCAGSHAAAMGLESHAETMGERAHAMTAGPNAAATVGGSNSVAVACGEFSRVKGVLGSALVCAEYDADGPLIAIKAAIVDGETIKADTWYRLENGEFVECDEGGEDDA